MSHTQSPQDLLWRNISSLPYFRGFLRAVEGSFYQTIALHETALDLGCGDGHFTSATFANRGVRFIGIDPDLGSLREAGRYELFAQLICAKGNQLPFRAGFFKTIVSNSVLEHIPDVDAVFWEANRVIAPKGKFLLCVPNSNFTHNLSIARFLDSVGLTGIAKGYRRLFNKISRHYHPDSEDTWLKRISAAGFQVAASWNYFTRKSLAILEWGHFFGLPAWVNRKLFGRWVLYPDIRNPVLRRIYIWLKGYVDQDQKTEDGAYSFFIITKG